MVSPGVYVDDVEVNDIYSWDYKTSISGITNYCRIIVDNSAGDGLTQLEDKHFADLKIYPATDALAWRGRIFDLIPHHDGTLEIIGYGYMRTLMNRYHVGTFTSQTRSEIVVDLVQEYGGGIGTGGVTATTGAITRLVKGLSVFDVLLDLAHEINYDIWVDDNNDFQFLQRGSINSSITIDLQDGSVSKVTAPSEGRVVYNQVIVYGDPDAGGGQPIALVEDRASQESLGVVKQHEPIVDASLQTVDECEERGREILDSSSTPLTTLDMVVFGQDTIAPGSLVRLTGLETRYGAADGDYLILERDGNSNDGSQNLKLAEYSPDTMDTLTDLIKRMRRQEYQQIDETATPTVFLRFYETMELAGHSAVRQRIKIGQTFIAGHSTNGIAGLTSDNIVTGYAGRSTVVIVNPETTT